VTAVLIATHFTPELQGYYYTFTTILALQIFVELGLGTVIVQFASHEWSQLALDNRGGIVGNREALARLISIADIAKRWYLAGGALAAVGLGIGGYLFFSTSADHGIRWAWPWLFLCGVTGISICLVPVWSLLEGCNQVANLYTFRFFQGVLVSLAIWVSIIAGAGLWTAFTSGIAGLCSSLFFLRRRYWTFLGTLLRSKPGGPRINWYADMLPMQWRIALSWISGYFVFSLFTPVLFKYHGSVIAGQFGMTWILINVVGMMAGSWLSPKIPQFGMLIAQKRYPELDLLLWKMTRIILGISVLIAAAVWGFVWMLNSLDLGIAERFASRLLPPLPTGIFLLAQLMVAASLPFSAYLRAHKREPLMFLSVLSGLLIGLSTFYLGKRYSATGMAAGYLILNGLIIPFVFLIWHRCRREWHVQ
jgi:O-antigen/teichoic acid export membrane protein